MFEVESAHSAKMNENGTVDLTVKFAHLDVEVPFTADLTDGMEHGRDIHARALAEEFGPVAEYVPPTPAEIAARDNPPLRRKQMKLAAEQATHWEMMGDATQAAAWRGYYRELYALELAPGWPLVEQWPEAPQ